jgi:hypothetical protein
LCHTQGFFLVVQACLKNSGWISGYAQPRGNPDGLFPQIVIDAVDLALVQCLQDLLVQDYRRGEVVAERLLDDHAALLRDVILERLDRKVGQGDGVIAMLFVDLVEEIRPRRVRALPGIHLPSGRDARRRCPFPAGAARGGGR